MTATKTRAAWMITLALLMAAGCGSIRGAYYNTWEKFGYAKRERLVDNVKAAREEQVEAKQQFASALEQFKSVVNFDGGDLEKMHGKLNAQYEACEEQAGEVNGKIAAVKNVANALFSEWEAEIKEMKDDPSLQASSKDLLSRTKGNYNEMIQRMDAAAASMDPVLKKFKARVLYIKHNLNAQAIASLKGKEGEISADVDELIREMEKSIQEADEFISDLQSK